MAEHEHIWGNLEVSRFAGTAHRKCQVEGCKFIKALEDDELEEDHGLKSVLVTMRAVGAWEVWATVIPGNVPDDQALLYVTENLSDLELELEEHGCDASIVESVEVL